MHICTVDTKVIWGITLWFLKHVILTWSASFVFKVPVNVVSGFLSLTSELRRWNVPIDGVVLVVDTVVLAATIADVLIGVLGPLLKRFEDRSSRVIWLVSGPSSKSCKTKIWSKEIVYSNYITKRSVRWYCGFSIAAAATSTRRPGPCWRREHSNSKKYSTHLLQILYVGRYPPEVLCYWNLTLSKH